MSRSIYDGTDEVRATIARLESRVRQTVAATSATHHRVVRNARSVLHASNAVLTEASCPQRPLPETGLAATELFLANSVGFNLQEQQRLLRHIASNRPQVTTVASDGSSGCVGVGHGGSNSNNNNNGVNAISPIDLEVALAHRRARTMKMAVDDVHRRMAESHRAASESAMATFADEQIDRVSELLGLQSLQLLDLTNGNGAAANAISSSSVLASRATEERHVKMAAFANAVEATPASEWSTVLPNVAIGLQGGDVTDPLAGLWSTTQGIVSQQAVAIAEGVASNVGVLSAVACSRAVLEEKFLLNMFGAVLGADAQIHYDDLCRMHPSRVRSIVTKYCALTGASAATVSSARATTDGGSADMWLEVFVAMRAGCYDTARLIAEENGKTSLATLIATVAAQPIAVRGRVPNSSSAIASLWNDAETRANAHRCAVLLILNGCNFNTTDDEGARQLISVVVERVASNVEDILWFRLCLISEVDTNSDDVSTVHQTSNALQKYQSLRELQRTILDDQQNILNLVNHDRIRFAAVLLHVLLPSTAIRILLDNASTFVDGVHVAMVFSAAGLLRGHSSEAETDLPRLLRRYATMLLEVPHTNASTSCHPSRVIFIYFAKSDCTSGFEQLCQNEVIATRLFGASDDLRSREGALLHTSDADSTLLAAMESVAQQAVAEGNLRLAVQMLTTIENLSSSHHDTTRASRALRSAVQALCTCMSHAIHSSSHVAFETFQQADKLFVFIEQKSSTDIPICEIDAFRSLRAMLHIHLCGAKSDEDAAIATVKSIPFIPTSAAAVESCMRKYREMVVSDDVATALPATCVLIMRLYQSCYFREVTVAQRRALLDRAQALLLWCRRWPMPPSADAVDVMHSIQQQMVSSS